METALGSIISALVLASMYILVALGFALIFSILGILNFAHGAIYMVGGYICYQLAVIYGLNQWLSLLLSVLIVGLIGVFLERFCFRPFSKDMLRTIIMAIAIILVLETSVNVTVGINVRSLPSFAPGILKAGDIAVSFERVITFAIGAVLLLTITLFVRRSRTGQQMLAISQHREGAALQGISIHRISALACFMGCALAAVAGSLMGAIFTLSPFMGDLALVKAIQLVVLGGLGSIGGVFFGGLIIGTIDAIVPLFTTPAVAQTVVFVVIIVLLLIKPQGLFGHEIY